MDKVRKEIVLKEIRYWKEHRLLPEQYCNFLLSLYTEGSEVEQKVYEKKSLSFKSFFQKLFYFYIPLQLFLTLVIIYFTETSTVLQIAFFSFFVIFSLSSSIYFKKANHIYFHIALIVGVLILFLASVHMIPILFMGGKLSIIITVLVNCLIWIVIGFKLGLKYLSISGIVGVLLILADMFI